MLFVSTLCNSTCRRNSLTSIESSTQQLQKPKSLFNSSKNKSFQSESSRKWKISTQFSQPCGLKQQTRFLRLSLEMELRCVQCGFGIRTLYIQYSPGNIRLMKCGNCKAVADEYIECEIMILLIDLILHKPKAYRHLLYNVLHQDTVNFEGLLWKSALGFVLLDAYRSLILKSSEEEWGLSTDISSTVSKCWKVSTDVLIGNLVFCFAFLIALKIFLNTSVDLSRFRELCLAILISSYFKIFLIAMMVWEFPSSVIFFVDLFVLSSNTVALKVHTESGLKRCLGACLVAHAAKFIVLYGLDLRIHL